MFLSHLNKDKSNIYLITLNIQIKIDFKTFLYSIKAKKNKLFILIILGFKCNKRQDFFFKNFNFKPLLPTDPICLARCFSKVDNYLYGSQSDKFFVFCGFFQAKTFWFINSWTLFILIFVDVNAVTNSPSELTQC